MQYNIIGHEMQALEIELSNGEVIIAEAGAMTWMEDGISFEAKASDGSGEEGGFFSKALSATKRLAAGESLFLTHFTNESGNVKKATFSAPFPGPVIPLELNNSGFVCQRHSFLCATPGIKLDIAFTQKAGAGVFGGGGFIFQSISGSGKAFIHASGALVEKQLNNQKLRIDPGCIAAFSEGLDFSIEKAGNLKSMAFGGEGIFLATLEGTGTVYLQSLPFSKLVHEIAERIPSKS